MMSITEDIRKTVKEELKREIATVAKAELGDTMFNIIMRGRQLGLLDNDMEELKQAFKKRLKEIV